MALTHDDVREILEIIDGAQPGEVRLQTDGFSLHLVIGERADPAASPPAASVAPPPPAPPAAPASPPDGRETIASPMLGTFYRAESPGADPFVEVGSVVEPETVVCIIEVMKMMNSVTAGVAGRIVEICSDSGTLVEFGAPLFRVEAS